MNSIREKLIRKFQDKEYRDAFVSEQIFSRLPLKIRSLREHRGLSQKDLGEKAGVAQAWVSKLEDPNYGKLTISTLLRLASAFDVGLEIDFVPYAKVLDSAVSLSPESFEVDSFAADKALLVNPESAHNVRRISAISTAHRREIALMSLPSRNLYVGRQQFFTPQITGGQYFAGAVGNGNRAAA